jgi:hypothetical protein
LTGAYAALADFNTASRLLEGGVLDPASLGGAGEALVLRDTGQVAIEDLQSYLEDHASRAADAIDAVLARLDPEGQTA